MEQKTDEKIIAKKRFLFFWKLSEVQMHLTSEPGQIVNVHVTVLKNGKEDTVSESKLVETIYMFF